MLQTGSQSKVSNETLCSSLCKNGQAIGTSGNLSIILKGRRSPVGKQRVMAVYIFIANHTVFAVVCCCVCLISTSFYVYIIISILLILDPTSAVDAMTYSFIFTVKHCYSFRLCVT